MCLVCAFAGSFAVFIHTRAVYKVLEKCYGTVNTPYSRETLKKKKIWNLFFKHNANT